MIWAAVAAAIAATAPMSLLEWQPGMLSRTRDPWPTFRGTRQNAGVATTPLRPLLAGASAASSRPLARFATNGLIWGTPVIGHDGTVYVGSADKRVYALGPGYVPRWDYPIFDRPDALIDSA